MPTRTSLPQWEKELAALRQALLALGLMHPGSLSRQYHACGTPTCRCHHPTRPQKHGPYDKLAYVHHGQNVCRFVRAAQVQELRVRLATYKTFRKLMDHWIELSIQRGVIDFFSAPARRRPPPPQGPH